MTRKPTANRTSYRPSDSVEVTQPNRFDITTYVTFKLGDGEYGIAFLKVRELLGVHEITPALGAQAHVLGMIHVRGKPIPLVDLRAKLGLSAATAPTAILVVQVSAPGAELTSGILVDEVLAVRAIQEAGVEAPVSLPSHLDRSLLLGVGKLDTREVFLLDIERVLADLQ